MLSVGKSKKKREACGRILISTTQPLLASKNPLGLKYFLHRRWCRESWSICTRADLLGRIGRPPGLPWTTSCCRWRPGRGRSDKSGSPSRPGWPSGDRKCRPSRCSRTLKNKHWSGLPGRMSLATLLGEMSFTAKTWSLICYGFCKTAFGQVILKNGKWDLDRTHPLSIRQEISGWLRDQVSPNTLRVQIVRQHYDSLSNCLSSCLVTIVFSDIMQWWSPLRSGR